MHRLRKPYLLFLGDVKDKLTAKTAFGLKDWCLDDVLGEWSLPGCTIALGLERMAPPEAQRRGAGSIIVGIAPTGGKLPPHWVAELAAAADAGLDVVSGLHTRLTSIPELVQAAARRAVRLIDVRHSDLSFGAASGRKRSGKRLLTVGTDCALGKKYTALALARSFAARGLAADFRATGQTGIMISGGGIPLDSVVADFAAGAAEMLTPDAPEQHWDVIEGQGSLFHPAYAGVSLGLLHGSQPDIIVVCHRPGREYVLGNSGYTLPSIDETMELNLRLGSRTNAAIRCAGISLDTSQLDAAVAHRLLADQRARYRLPVADPIRGGAAFEALVDACLGTLNSANTIG